MNNNFKIILNNNKEFINIMNKLFNKLSNEKEYIYYPSRQENSIKNFYENLFQENDIDFKKIIVHDPNSVWSREEHNMIIEIEDSNNITWRFEREKGHEESINTKEFLSLKKVYLTVLESDEMDSGLVIERESSSLKFHLSKGYKEIEFTNSEINQELIDLMLVTEDLDISKLKKINVKDIIMDISKMKNLLKQSYSKENKKGF